MEDQGEWSKEGKGTALKSAALKGHPEIIRNHLHQASSRRHYPKSAKPDKSCGMNCGYLLSIRTCYSPNPAFCLSCSSFSLFSSVLFSSFNLSNSS